MNNNEISKRNPSNISIIPIVVSKSAILSMPPTRKAPAKTISSNKVEMQIIARINLFHMSLTNQTNAYKQ